MKPDQDKVNKELSKYENKVSEDSIAKAEKAVVKFKNDKRISAFWERIQIMFEIAKHPKVWGVSVALYIGAALLYLVSPLDVIPDILPGVGLLDDILALAVTLDRIRVSIKTLIQNNPSILNYMPEKLRKPAMEVFGIESEEIIIDSLSEKAKSEDKQEDKIKKVKFVLFYNAFLGVSHAAKHFSHVIEKEKEKGKPNSFRARINMLLMKGIEVGANWLVDRFVVDRIQTAVDLAVERKTTKMLLSIISFSLALATYGMTQFGFVWVYVSSVLMLCSYSFILFAMINFFKNAGIFIAGAFRVKKEYPSFSYLDAAVAAVVYRAFKFKEAYTKGIMEELRTNEQTKMIVLRIVHRLFHGELSKGIIHFIMLSVVFFLIKWITIHLGFGISPLRIVLGPIMMLFGE